jgi:hypothetical protein
VGDLDLIRSACFAHRQRVYVALGGVALDVFGGCGGVEAIGLVVDDQRAATVVFDQEVDRAAPNDARQREQ